jgi:hypothetical protein
MSMPPQPNADGPDDGRPLAPGSNRGCGEVAYLEGNVELEAYLSTAFDAAKRSAIHYYSGSDRSWSEREDTSRSSGSRWLPSLRSEGKAFLDGAISADAYLANAHREARIKAASDLRVTAKSVPIFAGALATLLALLLTAIGVLIIIASAGTNVLGAAIVGMSSIALTLVYLRHASRPRSRR